ncbi:ceramidase domain-containing protein [Methylomarinum vadi]|uniref:ceramidase domain-containing protein n=1 Tax=Methylomarinum vadi TaxID=438855 RepID=UPI002285E4D2|nr:ceramidase domain-containing protein [Methylomarinum vadi]
MNALSNIAFLIAAWFAWRLVKQRKCSNGGANVLIVLIVGIGLGSFAFHTLANRWSMIMDLIPILLFQLVYYWLYGRKIMQLKALQSIALLSVFLVLISLGKLYPQIFNGSLLYFPTLLLLAIISLFHYLHKKTERWLILGVFALFLLSLSFRTLDNLLCQQIPLGTHFLWHLSCGLTVYLLTRALIVNLTEKI